MRHLAPQCGLSDVGFAKLLKRLNIPRLPVGYWAKRSAGQTPPRPPLPNPGEPLDVQNERDSIATRRRPRCRRELPRPPRHPLVIAAGKQLLWGRVRADGLLYTDARSRASISVSRGSMDQGDRI